MANTNKPFGLRPVQSLVGPQIGKIRQFLVPATDATAIFIGDPVKLAGTSGSINGDDATYPTATIGTINDVFVGVCVGVVPLYSDLTVNYRKASTAMYIMVDTDPNTEFEVQGDLDTFDAADVGLNMSLTFTAGDTTTGTSKMVADQSTAAVTATLDVSVLGTSPVQNNDLTGAFPLLRVRLNNHQYIDGTTGL